MRRPIRLALAVLGLAICIALVVLLAARGRDERAETIVGTYHLAVTSLRQTLRDLMTSRGAQGEALQRAVLAHEAYLEGTALRVASNREYEFVFGTVRLEGIYKRSGPAFRFSVPDELATFASMFEWPKEAMMVERTEAGDLRMITGDGAALTWVLVSKEE